MQRQSLSLIANARHLTAVAAGLLVAISTAQAQTTVQVGIVNTISDAGFYVAESKGYFRQEGLDVKFTAFNSAARMIAPLGAGQLDVGGGTVSAGLYNAVGRDIKIKIVADKGSIAPGYAFSALMVRKDLVDSGKYKSFKDLKGMKVAIGAAGTGTASALNEALKRGGLSYGDVEIIDLAFPQHMAAYTNKGIDASVTNEPTVTLSARAGVAVRVAGNDEIYPNQQTAVVLYSEEFMKGRPEAALKFMRAYIKGVRDYNDALRDGKMDGPNADEIITILTQTTEIKDRDIYRQISPNACNPDGTVNIDSLKKDLAFFKEQKLIEKDGISADSVVDHSFVQKVVQELGPYKRKAK